MQEQQVKPAEHARQGATGLGVRYVLGIGISLVVVAFAAIYIAQV